MLVLAGRLVPRLPIASLRASGLLLELGQTHAFPVKRVSELMRWVRSGEYDRIVDGEAVRRGDRVDPRAEASDAAEHYAERFRALLKDLGLGVDKAGDKVGDAAERLGEWLRDRRAPPES